MSINIPRVSDLFLSGGLSEKQISDLRTLWNKYKDPHVSPGRIIVTVEVGVLGSVEIKEVIECENKYLTYDPGEHERVSVSCKPRYLLWTDYVDIEPYNRMGGLSCFGVSFNILGNPKYECEAYREFDTSVNTIQNSCFPIYGFYHNEYHNYVRFGASILKKDLDNFLNEIRFITGKNNNNL